MPWNPVTECVPPAKADWSHSELVLVYYPAQEGQPDAYGVAYYHHSPPYGGPNWIDFSHYDREPILWAPIPALPDLTK